MKAKKLKVEKVEKVEVAATRAEKIALASVMAFGLPNEVPEAVEAVEAVASDASDAPIRKRTISEGVRDSWRDPIVRSKRATRNGVKANGAIFDSTRKAFRALRLPDSKHIAFRIRLKKVGKLAFVDGNRTVEFEIL